MTTREEELKKELYELNKIIEEYRAREDYSSPYQTYLIQQGEIKFELKGIKEGRVEQLTDDINTIDEIPEEYFIEVETSDDVRGFKKYITDKLQEKKE